MLLTFLCFVTYATGYIEYIPAFYRVLKRKSSSDYSMATLLLESIGTTAWAIYVFLSEQTFIVRIGSLGNELLIVLFTLAVWRYHNNHVE